MRTIVDILKKGNQELFHSSMIAWLLDPNGEHNLNDLFLKKFAEKLSSIENTEIINIIMNNKLHNVKTETVHNKRRYDINLKFGDKMIIIENKTKSLGEITQLESYNYDNIVILVALGFCDISFSSEVSEKFLLITYSDILDILEEISINPDNDFYVLVKHYKLYLKRELSILKLIDECYESNNIRLHDRIIKEIPSTYSKNDYRFLNLYFLERFRRKIECDNRLAGTIWKAKKNNQSGSWLANFKKLPNNYNFYSSINKLIKEFSLNLWFHIELNNGIFTEALEEKAGLIQLRCSTDSKNKEVLNEFKKIYNCKEEDIIASSTSNKYKSFYLVKRRLQKKDLQFKLLEKILLDFMNNFGELIY